MENSIFVQEPYNFTHAARPFAENQEGVTCEGNGTVRGNASDKSIQCSDMNTDVRNARLAQSAERKTLNLVVVGSSPTLGALFDAIFYFPDDNQLNANKRLG